MVKHDHCRWNEGEIGLRQSRDLPGGAVTNWSYMQQSGVKIARVMVISGYTNANQHEVPLTSSSPRAGADKTVKRSE